MKKCVGFIGVCSFVFLFTFSAFAEKNIIVNSISEGDEINWDSSSCICTSGTATDGRNDLAQAVPVIVPQKMQTFELAKSYCQTLNGKFLLNDKDDDSNNYTELSSCHLEIWTIAN